MRTQSSKKTSEGPSLFYMPVDSHSASAWFCKCCRVNFAQIVIAWRSYDFATGAYKNKRSSRWFNSNEIFVLSGGHE
jgi:hypothetical protein